MKLNKYIAILATCLLCSCTASNRDVTEAFKLPDELKEYKVLMLSNTDGNMLYVLVKKNNENRNIIGTTRPGKHPIHTIVIDDVEYVEKEQR